MKILLYFINAKNARIVIIVNSIFRRYLLLSICALKFKLSITVYPIRAIEPI